MDTTYVALVPYKQDNNVKYDELSRVAAALQIQLQRDLRPFWSASGVISAFAKLDDVPPGYVVVALVEEQLPLDHHGFHFAIGGLPFALVRYGDDGSAWSVRASHELLEMVVDPYGARTASAPSLADEKAAVLTPSSAAEVVQGQGPASTYQQQGNVDYLIEVCDPCQVSTYQINGVEVSDFVTPAYYAAQQTHGAVYSFQGAIGRPRQLLSGGDISWRLRILENSIFQASAPQASATASTDPVGVEDLTIESFGNVPTRLSRESIHAIRPTSGAAGGATATDPGFGTAFRENVDGLLKMLNNQQQPAPNLQNVIDFLKAAEECTDKVKLRKLLGDNNITLRNGVPNRLKADWNAVIDALEAQKKVNGLFGPDLFDPDFALWLCMLTN